MLLPHVNADAIRQLQSTVLELEGLVLNILLFVELCKRHFRK